MNKQETHNLSLTSEYFELLIDEIKEVFKKKHHLRELPKSMQLYGYGNYNPKNPSLKTDFERIGNEVINGKYLYDKERAFHKGKPVIKINQYYKSIILLYLRYDNIESFIKKNKLNTKNEDAQMALLFNSNNDNKTYYYLNYYFGEDQVIRKGKTIITNNWSKIKNIFRYTIKGGAYKEFYDFGNITKRNDIVYIKNKMLLNGKMVEGSSELFYVGQNNPAHLQFLIGAYCSLDIYNNTVSGRCILEKCESEEEMEKKISSPDIPAYIALEIRNKRIVNKSIVPKHFLELSKDSPYASIYENIVGTYKLILKPQDGHTEKFSFKVLPNNYKIISLDENVYIEQDRMELLNKGSVIYFSFDLAGIIGFDCLDIYFKTYYLKERPEVQEGVFSGVDNENRLVKGSVEISFSKAKLII